MLLRLLVTTACLLGAGTYMAHLLDLDDHLYYWWQNTTISQSEQDQAIWLPSYQIDSEAVTIPGISDNASGITFVPDTQTFFVVINQPTQLLELDRELQPIRTIKLNGFNDTEGVAYAGPGRLVIADERQQTVALATIDSNTRQLTKADLPQITLNVNGTGNKGFEGIAVDHSKQRIFAVRERDPMRLLAIDGLLDKNPAISINDPAAMDIDDFPMDDLSGLHFDNLSGNLLILSDESKLISEINARGEVVSYMDLEAGFNGLTQSVPQAEGITLDDEGHLYIVSEPNLIYRYRRQEQG